MIQNTAGRGNYDCKHQDTAVCLRYSNPVEQMTALMCGDTADECERLKRFALGPEHQLLADCEAFD
ncbi:hypothetical protein [Haliangium sp.]|uniref:hypothetical protein n=1 Tax=Haliangium sp. TaxID=2663208 RepID=UPI003D102B30